MWWYKLKVDCVFFELFSNFFNTLLSRTYVCVFNPDIANYWLILLHPSAIALAWQFLSGSTHMSLES